MNSDRRTLLILTPGFAKDEADTNCIPMQQSFIRSLKKKYPHLDVIVLAFQYPYFKKEYKWFDTTVFSFSGRNKGGVSKLLLRRKLRARLKKISSTHIIVGLLSFWYGECALVGKKFADKYGIKHHCWMWGQDAKKENKYVDRVHMKADELIAFSDFLQIEFEKNHGIKPGHVIPPGIDIKEFSLSNAKKDIDIIAAGSLIPLKQYDIFIEVIDEIKKTLPSVKAVLIGDGPEKKKLHDLIASSGLQSNIIVTGELPHPELPGWMQRGKVFLHPSSYEGFGIVCIEALCSGAQVISFVKPMNKNIEHWHTVNSKEAMAKKTLEILLNANTGHRPVVPFLIGDSVKAIISLFNQQSFC